VIVDGLLNFLLSLLRPLLGALPKAGMPAEVNDTAVNISDWLAQLDYYVPIMGPLRALILALQAAVPALLAFACGLWFYRRLRG
jgi:hypothetical protein